MKRILKKKLLSSCIVLFLGFFIFSFNICFAESASLVPTPTGPVVQGCTSSNCGNYQLSDFMVIAINVANWILGITGSLALAFFIYGGVMFLISAGSPEMVTKAKQIIIGAVIGLVIVFASYTIIRFVFQAAGLNWQGKIEAPKPAEETSAPAETPTEDGNCPGGICG